MENITADTHTRGKRGEITGSGVKEGGKRNQEGRKNF